MRISMDRSYVLLAVLLAAFLAVAVAGPVSGIAGWPLQNNAAYPVRFALPHTGQLISLADAARFQTRGAPAADVVLEGGADAGAMADDAKPSITGILSPADALLRRDNEPASTQPGIRAGGTGGPGNTGKANPQRLGDVMPVEYDIGTAIRAGGGLGTGTGAGGGGAGNITVQSARALAGTLDVRKPIRIGQGAPGRIDVKIGSGANIYLNGAQLASLMEAQGKALKVPAGMDENGFVSVDDLRSTGLKIRYDAGRDALVVDGEG